MEKIDMSLSETMRVREKQADISNGPDSPFITMDRRVWLDYADQVEEIEVLQRACIEFYCGQITMSQWREAVQRSPEGQRLISLSEKVHA